MYSVETHLSIIYVQIVSDVSMHLSENYLWSIKRRTHIQMVQLQAGYDPLMLKSSSSNCRLILFKITFGIGNYFT